MNRLAISASLATVAGVLLFAGPANAAAISTSGAAVKIAAPASVADGARTSDSQIIVFDESTVTLSASLVVNAWSPTGAKNVSLQANTCLQSHMIHYDRATVDGRQAGSATFSQPIVAIIPFAPGLYLTDSVFGAVGTTYPGGSDVLRGFEGTAASGEADVLTQPTPASLGFDLFERSTVLVTDSKMDQIRVITLCDPPVEIPEAGTVVLLSASAAALLAGGAAIARRRRTVLA